MTELFPGMKFIFSIAKKRRSTAFKRAMITQWSDIFFIGGSFKASRPPSGRAGRVSRIHLIRSQLGDGYDPARELYSRGLSQGCAMALFVLLSFDFSLGGFGGMSGWLPFRTDIDEFVCSRDRCGEENVGGFSFCRKEEDVEEIVSIQAVNLVRNVLSMDPIAVERSNASPSCLITPVFLGDGDNDEKVQCKLGKEAARKVIRLIALLDS